MSGTPRIMRRVNDEHNNFSNDSQKVTMHKSLSQL